MQNLKFLRRKYHSNLHATLSIERTWQLIRSQLRLPLTWRRKQRDWRPRLRPYGSWLARHTTAPSPDMAFFSLKTTRTRSAAVARRRNTIAR